MKSYIILLIALLISISTFAQQGINYKAMLKDANGNALAETPMTVQFSIHETSATGTIVYQEEHPYTTDVNGLLILTIGTDTTPIFGIFATIDWSEKRHFLRTTIGYSGGNIFFDPTEFMAVPYAKHATTSGDKSWESEVDNVHVLSKNVGIGTNTPTALLEIKDPTVAGIKLAVPVFTNTSKIEFNNGPEAGPYSFYKIENNSDILSFQLDTDISGTGSGYIQRMSLNNGGLALQNGSRINEFSNDVTLAGNSNTAVPTEQAVKDYVDAALAASGPLAYGSINPVGTINSGSGNYSVVWNSAEKNYEITITGETYNSGDYTTTLTSNNFYVRSVVADSTDGKLVVWLFNNSEVLVQGSFHFIVYK